MIRQVTFGFLISMMSYCFEYCEVYVLQQNNQKLALAIILHVIPANNTSYSPYINIYLTTRAIHYNQAHNTTTGQPSSVV